MPIAHLFREGRGATTMLLWVVNFMNLLNLYSLASWLPTVVTSAGYPQRTAVLVGTILQVGGTVGTFGLAWLVARRGFVPMLATTFAIACASIFLIGQPGLSLTLLFVVVFVAGWCVVGSQPGLNALAASYYPTYIRSTGVGAGLGVGRLGAIVGPLIGGYFIAHEVDDAGDLHGGGGAGADLDDRDDRAAIRDQAAGKRWGEVGTGASGFGLQVCGPRASRTTESQRHRERTG